MIESTNNRPLDGAQPEAGAAVTAQKPPAQEDASRKEVILYALGNVEDSVAGSFLGVLQQILIVAMYVNPLLIGFVMGIKSLWDSVLDPIVAHCSDNTRSRWGRRRPYLLVGGVGRVLFLLLFVMFLPTGGHLAKNSLMEAKRYVNESSERAVKAHETVLKSHNQWAGAGGAGQRKMLEGIAKIPAESREDFQKITANLVILREEAGECAKTLEARRHLLENALTAGNSREVEKARGLVDNAGDKLAKAEELIAKARQSRQRAIAAESVANRYLATAKGAPIASPAEAQKQADGVFASAGLEPIDIFSLPFSAPFQPKKEAGLFDGLGKGLQAFFDARNADQRTLVIYVLGGLLLFSLFSSLFSAPYYALGIELSPSYNGRTQVVTYRAVLNKITGLLVPWVPVFCFSLIFTDSLQGLFWVAVAACVIGVPCTIIMCWFIRERTRPSPAKTKTKGKANLLRSMWEIGKNPDFLRIFFLYTFIGLVNGIFAQVGFFLNVYWVMGSALAGATLGAWISMVAWGLSFLSLPVINWACRKFQKHRVLQAAIIWMALGTALKWWAMNPAHPEFQFVLPFFFSLGFASIYTVLPTMMADVTDVDQLGYGERREGMFGAVMGFMMKMIGSLVPILAGAVLLLAGFDPALEYKQEAATILNMRLMYSFIPAGMLVFALALLWRYPLTREKVAEIKAEIDRRLAAEG